MIDYMADCCIMATLASSLLSCAASTASAPACEVSMSSLSRWDRDWAWNCGEKERT